MTEQPTRLERYKAFIDHTQDAAGHTLNVLTSTTERSIASGIVLLSTGPEFVGSLNTTGSYVIAAAAASASVIGIRLARRPHKPTKIAIPFTEITLAISIWWLLYAIQFTLCCLVIWHHGGTIEIAYVGFSFIGGYYSDEIAADIKKEIAQAAKDAVAAERYDIKTEEMRAKSAARVHEYQQAKGIQPQAQALTADPPNADPEPPAITEEQRAKGQANSQKSRTSKVQARRETLYEKLVSQYPGVELKELNYSQLGRDTGVSADTAKRDLHALKKAGRINGRVPTA